MNPFATPPPPAPPPSPPPPSPVPLPFPFFPSLSPPSAPSQLARYCDQLLRKSSKDLGDQEVEDRLEDVVGLVHFHFQYYGGSSTCYSIHTRYTFVLYNHNVHQAPSYHTSQKQPLECCFLSPPPSLSSSFPPSVPPPSLPPSFNSPPH